ncbi:MAG TPA: hypothetical protein VGL99_08735 [Chloroflexota bacterium]
MTSDLIPLVDALEAQGYVTLEDVERAAGRSVAAEIAAAVLLVDYRERIDAATGTRQAVTLCRLNRQHPEVRAATTW